MTKDYDIHTPADSIRYEIGRLKERIEESVQKFYEETGLHVDEISLVYTGDREPEIHITTEKL